MFIDSRAVIHMVDKVTHFLRSHVSPKPVHKRYTEDNIQAVANMYMGRPDHLSVDQRSAYVSKEVQ